MRIEYPAFGRIVVDGTEYHHDLVLEEGRLRERDKGPSKGLKDRFGHTPLSVEEEIPWSRRLVIGSGYSGRLPILPEVEEEAKARGVDMVVMPTAEAVGLLNEDDLSETNAVLHVTC
ncbi:MAG: hypothetical protein ACRDVL_12540 [Acidimicrobiia bacterium]